MMKRLERRAFVFVARTWSDMHITNKVIVAVLAAFVVVTSSHLVVSLVSFFN